MAVIGYLQLRWQLWRMERWRRQTNAKYAKQLDEARARKADSDATRAIKERVFFEDRLFDEEIYRLHGRYLLAEASRLIIPTNKWHKEDAWEDGAEGRFLTPEAISDLRAAIRSEKKAQAERFLLWVPGVVGILGALIGLAAILVKSGCPKC